MVSSSAPSSAESRDEAAAPATDFFAQTDSRVGRYIVLSKLGVGGMGVVYGAYDPELDRKVALKFLLAGSGTKHAERRARLLREAQALAKFSHPEIVAIYDVGEHPVGVWLAMEFIEGRTLDVWVSEARPSWREVLGVMCAAGRGVAAAHAANLVHRDLKPTNIMVGHDGRVRVMDFGLTRASGQSPEIGIDEQPDAAGDRFTAPLTRRGSLLGTPAYMAPEQFLQGEITPSADQFSFCVTLWELLFGERPFAGSTTRELGAAVISGQLRPPSRRHGVPSWVLRVCERGLAPAPDQRWPSMQALLAQLDRGQSRERARALGLGLGLVACLVGAGEGYRRFEHSQRVTACEVEGAQIREVWNNEARAAVHAALVDTDTSYATDTADRVLPWLDAHARAWQTARTAACVNATVDQLEGWDAALLDESRWCLDERQMEFDALVARLASDDVFDVSRAVRAAASLGSVDSCLDAELLERLPAPPTDGREQAQAIRAELARAAALRATGDFGQGLAVAQQALEHAEALGWPPLAARSRAWVGDLLSDTGKFEDAAAQLEDAYFEAESCGALEVATDSAISLVFVVGNRLGRHAWGKQWSRHAQAALSTLPDPLSLREAKLLHHLAAVELASGSYAQARQLQERALELLQRGRGPNHPDIWRVLSSLALTHERLGEYEQARLIHERGVALVEDTLGPHHPAMAMVLNNLADNHRITGSYAEGKLLIERALTIKESAYGPEHPSVANSLGTLALILEGMGSYAEARPLLERVLDIKQSALGPEHPEVAVCLNNLAENYRELGEYEPALAMHQRALAIKEAALGPTHTSVALSLTNLASVYESLGELEQAKTNFERALTIFEHELGGEHPYVSYPLLGLAKIALARARPDDALTLAERALGLHERADSPPREQAEARFVTAQALWEVDDSPSRALDLARQAREGFREADAAELEAEVDAWLASRNE